jgi:hypothetical protein
MWIPIVLYLNGSFKRMLLKKYLGVVSWFTDNSLKYDQDYMRFLKEIPKHDLKFLIMGEPGFFMETPQKLRSKASLNEVWQRYGLSFDGDYFNNPLLMEYKVDGDKKRVEFERSLEGELNGFWALKIENKRIRPWLTLKTSQNKEDDFAGIIVEPGFGLVQYGYEVYTNPIDYKVQWRVDPFSLVKKVFINESFPIPDVTTLCGRRLSFIHIDGDGFINLSLIDKKSLSGEMVIEKIIKGYGFPTTASVVTAEVDADFLGTAKTEKLVGEMYQLPMVEPASHTFRHPLSWSRTPSPLEKNSYLKEEERKNHKGSIVAYLKKRGEIDYLQEIKWSSDIIDKKFTPRKKTNVVLWSGSCRPPEEALKIAYDENYLHMNGGDGRFDPTYQSYAGLSPLYRQIGPYTQAYSAFANENIYTNLWEGPFSGFRNVIKSFENTEKPIRVKPINVYYHFYSGERESSLKALVEIYDYLKTQEIAPVYASDYIKMVSGWKELEIVKRASDSFEISGYGHSRTLRMPLGNNKLYPDYKKSQNIIGHRIINGQLYITLAKSEKALLVLSENSPKEPYLYSCNAYIDEFNGQDLKGKARMAFEALIKEGENSFEVKEKTNAVEVRGWKK